MRDLEICPFCGSGQVECREVDVEAWTVECMDCHATGPIARSEPLSVTAWNRRHRAATGQLANRQSAIGGIA